MMSCRKFHQINLAGIIVLALLVLLPAAPSMADTQEWSIGVNDPIYPTLSIFVPTNAYDLRGYRYETDDKIYIAVRYSIDVSAGTAPAMDFTPGMTVARASHCLIVGYLTGESYTHMFSMPTPADWDSPWIFTKIEFAKLHNVYDDAVVLFTLGYEISELYEAKYYDIAGYTIDPNFSQYSELAWDPWPEFSDNSDADFRVSIEDNGIFISTDDPESYHAGERDQIEMLYVLGEYSENVMTGKERDYYEEEYSDSDNSYDSEDTEDSGGWDIDDF